MLKIWGEIIHHFTENEDVAMKKNISANRQIFTKRIALCNCIYYFLSMKTQITLVSD